MKKITLITLILNFYFFNSYSQEPVTFENKLMSYTAISTTGVHETKFHRRLVYKIGEGSEKLFDSNEQKTYKEYIAADKNALKYYKRYKNYRIVQFSSIGLFVVAIPVFIVSIPAGAVVAGVALVSVGTCNLLSVHSIKKSGKIFNLGLKGSKKEKKLK